RSALAESGSSAPTATAGIWSPFTHLRHPSTGDVALHSRARPLFEDTTPAKPVINPNVGFMVGVRTGQPGFFYTPKQVEALQRHLPFASKWYAVFNAKTSTGTAIDVIYNGKLYKVFS
ncbi:hypothetical protein, partial [Acidithiobacillus sp.]|uniref:hypothetical protein n=1 Tax=Acidithiobacillus sp. TaxID=1872118 RepID=UPI00258CA08C